MKHITKLKLAAVHARCDEEDKSLEFTLQFMQNLCKVDLDTCIKYMVSDKSQSLRNELNSLSDLFIKLKNLTEE